MNTRNTNLTLMAVHAHPDDEAIGTGGILAKYAAEGIRTILVYGTRGEAGEILNPEFVPPSPGLSIKEIRALELEKALEVLRVESVHFLGYRDSGVAGSPENLHPQAFVRADLKEAAGRLAEIIRRTRPHVIVTYNEKGFYGHPDHIMCNRVTLHAFQAAADPEFENSQGLDPWRPAKLYYTATPIARLRTLFKWALERDEEQEYKPEDLGTPDEKISTIIDVREYLPQKLKALYGHQSQIGPDSFFRRLPEERREEVFGYEYFECVNGCTPLESKEIDLFDGLR
jgi:N-acetyl-1-D-myo-inositol-2-amino-2-deoxy-alpha-D-glucopyranoside deacetylase